MTIQKTVQYNSLINNQMDNDEYKLKFNVLEYSANYLIHKDILRHRLSQNQGTVSTKTRSEIRGGGRKPWKQKGTGRARAGSNSSPLWKGGGVIFGPKPRQIELKLNKKERKLALQTLLYNKRNNIQVLDNFEELSNEPKTKVICNYLKKYNIDLDQKILIIVGKKLNYLKLSTRNVKNIELISVMNLNTLSLLKAKQIILTLPALKKIKETYAN
uniref:Large ribosomal subunit protein uL4c n=1 Tax=Toxarium undulatum TaxID=210620 RepID=A0A1D8D9L0_9STRA|nr:ribosomal protein L4 [Toxarium undulatum]AOS86646.1 ribosomal protein L4 [Toxarium undulatum]